MLGFVENLRGSRDVYTAYPARIAGDGIQKQAGQGDLSVSGFGAETADCVPRIMKGI